MIDQITIATWYQENEQLVNLILIGIGTLFGGSPIAAFFTKPELATKINLVKKTLKATTKGLEIATDFLDKLDHSKQGLKLKPEIEKQAKDFVLEKTSEEIYKRIDKTDFSKDKKELLKENISNLVKKHISKEPVNIADEAVAKTIMEKRINNGR